MYQATNIQRSSSRNKPRGSTNWYNMKNSAPTYPTSLQNRQQSRDQKNILTTNISSSKNTYTYDYGNTALKSLIKDKNVMEPIPDRNRESSKGLINEIDGKRDTNKK